MRHQRHIGQRQAQARKAAVVDVVELRRRDVAVIDEAKWQLAHRIAVQMQFDLGVASGEHLERHQTELERSARRAGPRIERHPAPRATVRTQRVARQVAAELEGVGLHAEIGAQHAREPGACGDGVKPHAVGVFGQHAQSPHGVKARLMVLHEVVALAAAPGVEHRVGRGPGGGHHRVCIGHRIAHRQDRSVETVNIAHHLRVVAVIATVDVVEVDAVVAAMRLQVPDHPKQRRVPTRARARRRGHPVHAQRLAGSQRGDRGLEGLRQIGSQHIGAANRQHGRIGCQRAGDRRTRQTRQATHALVLPGRAQLPGTPRQLRAGVRDAALAGACV